MSCVLKYFAILAIVVFCGCSEATSHKVLSTIFDGVPSLPPPQQYCEEYAAQSVAKLRAELEGKAKDTNEVTLKSSHPPYDEKKCDSCHDKTADSGFVSKTKNELCFVCHTNFLKNPFVHGPAAVGDCLACHDPHTATNPFLLKTSEATICAKCHQEGRQASSLHGTSASRGMVCINCHNPHDGNTRFFLK
jgi:predicted CXXCH cytochrome family protein